MGLLDKLLDKNKPKQAPDVISKTVAAFDTLAPCVTEQSVADPRYQKLKERALESVNKQMLVMKLLIFGDEDQEPKKETVLQLAEEAVRTDLLPMLVRYLEFLDFETRKDTAMVFGALVRIKSPNDRCLGAQYVAHPSNIVILSQLFKGYDTPSIALNCGSMLRDCIRDEQLARVLLYSATFPQFFKKVEVPNFEVASDAFSTFKDLLTRHRSMVSQYLQENYAKFFPMYKGLLESSNYVTRRQSLKLLGELLLDRMNIKVMVRFVSELAHLKVIMDLLRDQSRSIQFEAFHVFKVFVANPMKPPEIAGVLANNKDKLLKYLEDFQNDRDDDEQFKEEKGVIIKEISNMVPVSMMSQAQSQPPTPPSQLQHQNSLLTPATSQPPQVQPPSPGAAPPVQSNGPAPPS